MASRTISTRLVIEGESEYRQSVAHINSSLGVLKSELSKVKAEYASNANGMDALRAKGQALGNMQAEQAVKVRALETALAGAKAAQQGYAAKVEECRAKVAAGGAEQEKYNKELAAAERYNEAAQRGVNNWQKQLNNAQRDVAKLNTDIKRNDDYLSEAKKSTDGCATSIDQYGKKVKSAAAETGASTAAVAALTTALAAGGLKMAFDKVAEAITACVKASMEYETAITGVYKTVDGSEAQLTSLSDGIKRMATEIPATTTEIAAVAAAAGQLGIATEDVLGFTRVMLDLGQSTNLSAEEAASALAKFANITGTSAEDYSRLGASIVDLGNNFATTEADIVAMATRIASTGTLTGLTEAQIMALSTTLSSLGIEAEAGGSAISRLLKDFEVMVATSSSELDDFASIAGMSADEFASAWGQDALGALSAFLDGLGDVDAAGGSSVATIERLGIKEVRLSNATLAMAGSGDLLARAISTANTAWAENSALAEEASKRYATSESKVAILNNAFSGLTTTIGDTLAPAINSAAESGTDLSLWATELVRECPWLVSVVSALAAGLGTLTIAVAAYSAAVVVIIPIIKTFTAALAANPATMVAVSIGVLIAAIGTFAITCSTGTTAAADLNKKLSDTVSATEDATKSIQDDTAAKMANLSAAQKLLPEIDELNSKNSRTAEEQGRLNALVSAANKLYPDLIGQVNGLTGAYDFNRVALNGNIEAMKQQLQVEAAADIAAEKYKAAAELRIQLIEAEEKRRQASAMKSQAETAALGVGESSGYYKTYMDNARGYGRSVEAAEAAIGSLKEQIGAYEAQAEAAIGTTASLASQSAAAAASAEKLTQSTHAAAAGIEKSAEAGTVAAEKLTDLKSILEKTQGGYELLSKAQNEMNSTGYLSIGTVSAMLEKYPELYGYLIEAEGGYRLADGALQGYVETQRAEYALTYDNADAAAQKLINAEAQKRGALIDTTQSVKAQLTALAALYDTTEGITANFGDDYKNSDDFYAHSEIVQGRGDAIRRALAELESAEQKLENYDRTMSSLGRSSGSGSKSSGANKAAEKQEKQETTAEKELRAYREAVTQLDHLRSMDYVSEEAYYEKKQALGAQYLSQNAEEQQKLSVELHKFKLTQNEQEFSDLKYDLDIGIMSEQEYYKKLSTLRDQYCEKDSAEWRRHTLEIADYNERMRKEALASVQKAAEEQRKAMKTAYDNQLSDAKTSYDAGISAARDSYSAQKDAAQAAYQKKKEIIESELALEREKTSAIIDGIDAEIAARRNLREDEGQDDAISAAQKRLNAAKAQLSFARSEEDKRQWENEVTKLEKTLQDAIKAKEDTEWYREKELEKEAAKDKLTEAEKAAEAAKKAAEVDYKAGLTKLEADYKSKLAQLEASYQANIARMQAEYKAQLAEANRRWDEIAQLAQKPSEKSAVPSAQSYAGKLAGVNNSAGRAMSQTTNNSISNTAQITVNKATGLTEGQLVSVVGKVINEMGR